MIRKRLGGILLFLMIAVTSRSQYADIRMRTYIAPTRIVWQYNGSGGLIHNINALLKLGDGQGVLTNRNLCVMKSMGNEYPSFLILEKRYKEGCVLLPGSQKVKIR